LRDQDAHAVRWIAGANDRAPHGKQAMISTRISIAVDAAQKQNRRMATQRNNEPQGTIGTLTAEQVCIHGQN